MQRFGVVGVRQLYDDLVAQNQFSTCVRQCAAVAQEIGATGPPWALAVSLAPSRVHPLAHKLGVLVARGGLEPHASALAKP